IARKALEQHLTSSALHSDVKRIGAFNASNRRTYGTAIDALREPTTMRAGFMKSSIADPSRRNSGARTSSPHSSTNGARRSQVPGGTVERITMVGQPAKLTFESALSAASKYERSADPSLRDGVLTVTNTVSVSRVAAARSSKK